MLAEPQSAVPCQLWKLMPMMMNATEFVEPTMLPSKLTSNATAKMSMPNPNKALVNISKTKFAL